MNDELAIEHNKTKHRACVRYLRSIRNPFKRTYGVKYFGYLQGNNLLPEAEGISFMAAQAVRMRIQDIMGGGKSL
jgi:hypothetical protein